MCPIARDRNALATSHTRIAASVGAAWITAALVLLGSGCARLMTKPVPTEELASFRSEVTAMAQECCSDTTVLGGLDDKFKRLAEQAASNVSYERQAPRQAAIAYRLYAAHLLIQPNGRPKQSKIRDAMPWLDRAVKVDKTVGDFEDFKASTAFFSQFLQGEAEQAGTEEYVSHLMRVSMVEATREQVAQETTKYMDAVAKAFAPSSSGGASLSEDVDYLESYKVGGGDIRMGLFALRLRLMQQYPGKDVGSGQASYINTLPNGNTCVRYEFMGDKPLVVEFEVNKARKLVLPRNDLTKAVLDALKQSQ